MDKFPCLTLYLTSHVSWSVIENSGTEGLQPQISILPSQSQSVSPIAGMAIYWVCRIASSIRSCSLDTVLITSDTASCRASRLAR